MGRSYLGREQGGRITPLAPGCQPSLTIIGAGGEPIVLNHIFETPTGTEGGGEHGQLAIDMSPVQPQTTTKDARSCDSCHASEKALGRSVSLLGQQMPGPLALTAGDYYLTQPYGP